MLNCLSDELVLVVFKHSSDAKYLFAVFFFSRLDKGDENFLEYFMFVGWNAKEILLASAVLSPPSLPLMFCSRAVEFAPTSTISSTRKSCVSISAVQCNFKVLKSWKRRNLSSNKWKVDCAMWLKSSGALSSSALPCRESWPMPSLKIVPIKHILLVIFWLFKPWVGFW